MEDYGNASNNMRALCAWMCCCTNDERKDEDRDDTIETVCVYVCMHVREIEREMWVGMNVLVQKRGLDTC